jgi:Zn-finger nucleic acid-binding protein
VRCPDCRSEMHAIATDLPTNAGLCARCDTLWLTHDGELGRLLPVMERCGVNADCDSQMRCPVCRMRMKECSLIDEPSVKFEQCFRHGARLTRSTLQCLAERERQPVHLPDGIHGASIVGRAADATVAAKEVVDLAEVAARILTFLA